MVAKASVMVAFSLVSRGVTLVGRRSSSKHRCQIGGPYPDAMTHRDPVDRNQGVAVLFDTGDRGGVTSPVGVGEAIGGGSSASMVAASRTA